MYFSCEKEILNISYGIYTYKRIHDNVEQTKGSFTWHIVFVEDFFLENLKSSKLTNAGRFLLSGGIFFRTTRQTKNSSEIFRVRYDFGFMLLFVLYTHLF